jgi:DNA polymerase-3 subunit delta
VAILALDLLKKPDLLEARPLYVIMGEDVFLRSESILAIERLAFADDPDKMGLTKRSGDTANLADVMDELATQSFFSPMRMIVLDPADGFVTKHRAELEKYAAKPCQGSVLVLAVKQFPSSTNLFKVIDKGKPGGLVIDTRPPKAAEMVGWVQGRAAMHDTKIERDAAVLLTELIGPEPGLLDQELEKLAVATHDGKKSHIRRDDVARYVHAGQTDSIWAVIEKAATGQGPAALADLDALLSSGENAVGLLAAMAASLRKLHHAGVLRMRKVNDDAAFAEAGFPTWAKAIEAGKAQHKHLGPRRVNDLPNMLAQADLDLKGWSELKPQTVMERLMVRLAQPRKD